MVRNDSPSGRRNGTRGLGQVLLLVATVDVGLVACGRSNVWFPGDAYKGVGNDAGKAGGAGKGTLTGGTGGTFTTGGTGATGGSFMTGGAGGSGNVGNGGTISSGGFPLGGMGGTAGVGGAAGAGPGPFACPSVPATCDTFSNFSTSGTSFGAGAFTGGFAVFGEGLSHTDGPNLHVTGTVSNYGSGIVMWFTNCADLSAFWGVTFVADGGTGMDRKLEVMVLTNSNYPWQPRPQDGKGACTAMNPDNPWLECVAPSIGALLGPLAPMLNWGAFRGGTPVPWDSVEGPRELVGLQWTFPYSPEFGPYMVDMTLDDVSFVGGSGNDCGPGLGVGGMGGMGGIAGFGGISGNNPSGGFAGSAGMSGSGAGGMSGAGFGGGGFSGGGFNGGGFSGDSAGTSSGGLSGSVGGTSAGEGGFGGEGGA